MSELHEAASTGNLEQLEDNLLKGRDPNEPDPEWGGKTPLHIACSNGHKKCVFVLLKAGANVNAVSETGWTPAHSACETGQAHCLQTIVSAGCDLNIADQFGDTAKCIAEIYGQQKCLQVIEEHCKKGCDLKYTNSQSDVQCDSNNQLQCQT